MKKIGLIALALVLGLGALGVAYAPWTDEVYIEQVVETGTLCLGIVHADVRVRGDTKNIMTVEWEWEDFLGEKDYGNPDWDNEVYRRMLITMHNAYPCVLVDTEFYVTTLCSVPLHITGLNVYDPTGYLTHEWETASVGFFYVTGDENKTHIINTRIINLVGTQLHECDVDKADFWVKFKQPMEQNREYNIVLEVLATQYNWP